jgi:sterol desaturase/sphingolipid hydroxylase (fatty acid hydroxylase superfamily)
VKEYLSIFINGFKDYWNYISNDVTHPGWHSYFYWLIGLSLVVWMLEIIIPWRKKQGKIRKDFWQDGFYMFFNFFIFYLIIYNGLSNVFVKLLNDVLTGAGITNLVLLEISSWPIIVQLLFMFLVADFVQWNVHRLLHKYPKLWEFHKLHHSIKEMGFAGHLRFHWMESIIYKAMLYIPFAIIGFGFDDMFVVHIITISIGHLNHANLNLDYGPFKYVLNNPKMHIWHHAKEVPVNHKQGVNFGISLSLWDYIFKTAHVPTSGRDIELGFQEDEKYPKNFIEQITYPLSKRNETDQ